MAGQEPKKTKDTKSKAVQTNTLAHRRWQDLTHAANTSIGHKSMQLSKEPPGQSPDGVGDGAGDGAGAGEGGTGPPVVLPRGPHLMSENLTLAFGVLDSTSFGIPESAEHDPL